MTKQHPYTLNIKQPSKQTLTEIRDQYRYDPKTGVLVRLICGIYTPIKNGTIVNGHNANKAQISWYLAYGKWPNKSIDHKDRNHNNNRLNNLRLASIQEQNHNRGAKPSDHYRGVNLLRSGRWGAYIKHNRKSIFLGAFDTKQEAAMAYDAKAKALQGEFAILNFEPVKRGKDTPHKVLSREDRFWARVKKAGENECWEWQGSLSYGYGQLSFRNRGKLQTVRAHRYSYELTNGKIPNGMLVLHSCDNKACVNPKHLRAGTNADNIQEAVDRGLIKGKTGANNHNAKLKVREISTILRMRDNGMSYQAIANEFGVLATTISELYRGITWKDEVAAVRNDKL